MSKVMLCRQCGKLFQSWGSSTCPACIEDMDKAFKVVKDYLYDHQDATVIDVVDDTGIPEKYVLAFLKEGRLNIENGEELLTCEDCGKPIPGGRYCIDCRNKLANVLDSAVSTSITKEKSSPETRVQAKMHSKYGRD